MNRQKRYVNNKFIQEQANLFAWFESIKQSKLDLNQAIVQQARGEETWNHFIAQIGSSLADGRCFYDSLRLCLEKIGLEIDNIQTLREDIVNHMEELYYRYYKMYPISRVQTNLNVRMMLFTCKIFLESNKGILNYLHCIM
jgi:hypothetical protein